MGGSLAAYARKRGYQAQRLSWWQKRLEDEQGATKPERVALAPAVIASASRAPMVVTVDETGVRVELEDPTAVHPAWVAELVAALRGGGAA